MNGTASNRISKLLAKQPLDRIGLYETFWADALVKWRAEGHLGQDEQPWEHFDLDIWRSHPLNLVADPTVGEMIVEQDEATKLVRDGNGSLLRYWKDKCGTPEHIDYLVKDRQSWQQHLRPLLTDERLYEKRIDFQGYRKMRQNSQSRQKFLICSNLNVFELMMRVCGHEYMLMGMALDPDWIHDMCQVFTDLLINLQEILFAQEGLPDGAWYFEDMGFKHKPFMSPQMYREMLFPAHRRTFGHAHSRGLPVFVHSCGFIEPLVPGLIEAGMDCLQAIEIKAGMDLLRLKRQYGDRIALCGGLDTRVLETNDKPYIRQYLQETIPVVMENGGYILHTDHSVPQSVEYDTYRYFVNTALTIGTYR